MSARIQLDGDKNTYTSFDCISGKIIVFLSNDEDISAIVVKLEGESFSKLLRPSNAHNSNNGRRDSIATEVHKVLYQVHQVFPRLHSESSRSASKILQAGKHEFPFQFQFPSDNECGNETQTSLLSGFAGVSLLNLRQQQLQHVKQKLPPTLTALPGTAEIRYFIKVTVQRRSLFKENWRSELSFKFLPTEPPRPQPTSNQFYVRMPFSFLSQPSQGSRGWWNIFKKQKTKLSELAPEGEIDVRFPGSAILTWNKPPPFHLIVRRTNRSSEQIFMVSCAFHLHGKTLIRAKGVMHIEKISWVLLNICGSWVPIGLPDASDGNDYEINNSFWSGRPLPQSVCPSFDTCNLGRSYELQIRVSLSYGKPGDNQVITIPFQFPVEVYSGILVAPQLDVQAESIPTALEAPYFPHLHADTTCQDPPPPTYEEATAGSNGPSSGRQM
ncbi:Bgt-1803 [Blumeria graminis f. sp. tritici]|uniref:Bgt-1803 n=2 Tax=Blumeria graminis f. sp. tritici TaxID=62690 RepID=A0A061HFU3_BLUGR|nr:hypothetical protein BGT96224_1803 [Blumeria graminis f. sp. tritici 96224]VCU39742.1 Bgt-1803 [Blumeria graminis f. sp. tritici]